MNPFEFVNDLSFNKKDIIRNSENPEEMEKAYNPFMTNRAFSYYPDSILHANEMNQCQDIDNLMQYDYYYHSLRSKKRFSKWFKAEDDSIAEIISEAYHINIMRAKELKKILSKNDIETIKRIIAKGGRNEK